MYLCAHMPMCMSICASVHVHIYTHIHVQCYVTTVWCCTHCVMCQLHPLHRQCGLSITVLSSLQLTVHPLLKALAPGGYLSHTPRSLCRLKGRGTASPHSHLPPPWLCPSTMAVPTQGIQSWCVRFTHFGGTSYVIGANISRNSSNTPSVNIDCVLFINVFSSPLPPSPLLSSVG